MRSSPALRDEIRSAFECALIKGALSQVQIAREAGVSRWQVQQAAREVDAPARRRKIRKLIRPGGSAVAFVEVAGKRHYLGPWPKRHEAKRRSEYHASLAEIEAASFAPPATAPKPPTTTSTTSTGLTIDAYLVQYNEWLLANHTEAVDARHSERKTPRWHVDNLRYAVKRIQEVASGVLAADLKPDHLLANRRKMIQEGRARSYISATLQRVKQIFAWDRGRCDGATAQLVAARGAF